MNRALMDFLEHLLWLNLHFTIISSSRRSVFENESAGGAPTSQHLFVETIDMKPYGSTTYGRLLEHIHNYLDNTHVFDQLILYPTFIHISFSERNRRQVIDKRK